MMALCGSVFATGYDQHRGTPKKGDGGTMEGQRSQCYYQERLEDLNEVLALKGVVEDILRFARMEWSRAIPNAEDQRRFMGKEPLLQWVI